MDSYLLSTFSQTRVNGLPNPVPHTNTISFDTSNIKTQITFPLVQYTKTKLYSPQTFYRISVDLILVFHHSILCSFPSVWLCHWAQLWHLVICSWHQMMQMKRNRGEEFILSYICNCINSKTILIIVHWAINIQFEVEVVKVIIFQSTQYWRVLFHNNVLKNTLFWYTLLLKDWRY